MPNFAEVLEKEREEIRELRRRRHEDPEGDQPVGIAFSGGGIRSATFNLGVLQGLATYKLLKRFDYMSTVSGGGYIGSWLANWIKRAGVETVEHELASAPPPEPPEDPQALPYYQEPEPINFLREYSNYLTPRVGIFGADTWAAIATYLRNVLLNMAILVAVFAALLLTPRFVQAILLHSSVYSISAGWWSFGLALLLMVFALTVVTMNIADFSVRECESELKPDADTEDRPLLTAQKWVLILGAVPIFLAAFLATYSLWFFATRCNLEMEEYWWLGGGAIGYFGLRLLGILLGRVIGAVSWPVDIFKCVKLKERSAAWAVLVTAPFAGLLGGFLLRWIAQQFCAWTFNSHPALAGLSKVEVFGPPFMVATFLLTGVLHLGLMGLTFENQKREWWARSAGWLLLGCLAWLLLFGLAIYAPVGVIMLSGWVKTKAAAVLAWAGSTLSGILGGNSDKTSGEGGGNKGLNVAATAAPYVFVLGFLVLVSYGINLVVPPDIAKLPAPENAPALVTSTLDAYWLGWSGGPPATSYTLCEGCKHPQVSAAPWSLPYVVLAWWIGLVLVAVFLALRVDINEFSMHLLYRNRLVRCYLGASNPKRDPQRFTGFDPEDDKLLATFSTVIDPNHASSYPYAGPYPIINAALNLTHGERLAWQERKAESFVFTPRYCGFEFQEEHQRPVAPTTAQAELSQSKPELSTGGFRDTEFYAYPTEEKGKGGVYLGTAFAISGAAASPNMGYHTSPPLAFLMTIFNVRLGWWLGNPRRRETWQRSSPFFSLPYLFYELFATTDDFSRYIYLSDGGHFENLGIYELVRRQCTYIVACDADADGGLAFNDLGNAIRKCRSDFGVEIDIRLDKIKPEKDHPYSQEHCAVGNIYYPNKAEPGKLLYIKTSLTGDEPQDVLAYKAAHPEFPHQSTADQWFDESQFESYRALGRFVVESALEALGDREQVAGKSTEELFEALDAKYSQS
jgi:Patatin-like phospholipase